MLISWYAGINNMNDGLNLFYTIQKNDMQCQLDYMYDQIKAKMFEGLNELPP